MTTPLIQGMLSSLLMSGVRGLVGNGSMPTQVVAAAPKAYAEGGIMGMLRHHDGAPIQPGGRFMERRRNDLAGMGYSPFQINSMSLQEMEDIFHNNTPPIPPGETPAMAAAMDRGGMIRGPGSGVQDLVHGSIDNRQKVLLSDGEFVVPARVVSALGDGSSEAGAKVLHEMLDRVKQEAAKKLKDNGEINLNKVLPA